LKWERLAKPFESDSPGFGMQIDRIDDCSVDIKYNCSQHLLSAYGVLTAGHSPLRCVRSETGEHRLPLAIKTDEAVNELSASPVECHLG
jgi:hypothetical protein